MDIAQYFKVGEEGGAFNQVLRALRVCHEDGDPHVTCIDLAGTGLGNDRDLRSCVPLS